MTSIISREGHALDDSGNDVYHTSIVDIICIGTDIMRIIQEDYHLTHVKHEGGKPPAQLTVARLPPI